jgi:cell wall-associated NlpC family hydrolase
VRSLGVAAVLALTLTAGGVASDVALADPTPSRQDVRDARAAVVETANDVDAVRAALAVANQRLQQSAVVAAQAAEAYNGARWRAEQARAMAAEAQRRSQLAETDVRRQREAYGDALVSSYELAPGLTALSAMVRSDGIGDVVQQATSLQNAESALDSNYDSFRASATVAAVSVGQARDAQAAAVHAAQEAREARDAAQAAADAAAADAASIARQKSALIARLAQLQHVSLALAQRRQSDLEARAAAAAAAAAQQAAEEAAQQAAQQAAAQAAAAADEQDGEQDAAPSAGPHRQPHSTGSASPSAASPAPAADPSPPAPASGAGAAIAFARAQIGEPYVWGAAGPGSWDCSGLTMGAWAAGGKYLPHYSVAQYEQSTPISPTQLRPGDLVFWGSTSDPGSIYHVALYVGGGRIIQAPRTGVPVYEGSMYDWIAPNFYARP